LKAPVGTSLTTAWLKSTLSDKDKAAASLPLLALLPLSMISALPVTEVALILVVPVVLAKLMLELITASSSTPTLTTIATTPMVKTTLDFLPLKSTVEKLVASASKVLWEALVLLLSASSSHAVELDLALVYPLELDLKKLSVLKKALFPLLDIPERSTALIL